MPIRFHYQDIPFRLKAARAYRELIQKTIVSEKKTAGDINYIFCTDDYLLAINLEYLEHDDLTDIITFDYSEKKRLNGDIFISIDRVRENARTFGVQVAIELKRVMIHGVLHLAGYKDKEEKDISAMRKKENFYMNRF